MWIHSDYSTDKYALSEEGVIEQLGDHDIKSAVEIIKTEPGTFSPKIAGLIDRLILFAIKDYRSTLRSHVTSPRWRKTIYSIELLISYA